MNNIILSISLIVSFLSGFLVAIKSVQLGLRWNMQVAEKQETVMHNPIAEAVQAKKDEKARDEAKTFIEEVLYGERG
jgi:uncharacterized protein YneF (UPF0154 family)